jgi:hypothetical protein
VILIVCAGNDFWDTTSDVAHGKRKPLFSADGPPANVPIRRWDPANAVSSSRLLNRLKTTRLDGLVTRLTDWLAPATVLEGSEGGEVIAALLGKIHDLAGAHGAKLIVVLVPSGLDFPDKSAHLRWFQDLFEERPRYEGYLDWYPEIRKDAERSDGFYLDDYHLSPKANRRLADALFDVVAAMERTPS